ncbi:VOC family protein [Enterococcus ureilyticus]|uniref:VOC family protein n=1 Tax=Enterococcus ureilyticus TaxID=1131292 RepID=UPI001EF850C1|nr:VOC family protein [Enterococcus ureilyticus]
MPKFSPCLWFDGKVEEVAEFYVHAFEQSKINKADYYVDSEHQPKGSVFDYRADTCRTRSYFAKWWIRFFIYPLNLSFCRV